MTAAVYTSNKIRDAAPRGIAAMVSTIVHGKKTDGQFTHADIQTVRDLLDRPGELERRGVSEHLIGKLGAQLDVLEQYLVRAGDWIRADVEPTPPFCDAFKPSALFSHELRACATALGGLNEGGGDHLSLGEYLRFGRLWTHLDEGTTPTSERLAASFEKFKVAVDEGKITREAYDALHGVFLNEAVARAQFNHGPIRVGGRTFEHVFRLDTDDKDVSGMDMDKLKSHILHRYEAEGKALHDSFYDRIYIEYQGSLYLALNDGASVTRGKNKIPDDAAVTMREDGRQRDVGRIVHRQAAVNSLTDAIRKVYEDMKGLLTGDGPLKQLLEADKRAKKGSDAEPNQTHTLLKLLVAATVSAPLLAAFKTWGLVGLAGVGVIATGRNVTDFVRAATDDFKMRPVYHAIGVGLATDDI